MGIMFVIKTQNDSFGYSSRSELVSASLGNGKHTLTYPDSYENFTGQKISGISIELDWDFERLDILNLKERFTYKNFETPYVTDNSKADYSVTVLSQGISYDRPECECLRGCNMVRLKLSIDLLVDVFSPFRKNIERTYSEVIEIYGDSERVIYNSHAAFTFPNQQH